MQQNHLSLGVTGKVLFHMSCIFLSVITNVQPMLYNMIYF